MMTLVDSTTLPGPWYTGSTITKASAPVCTIPGGISPFVNGDVIQIRNADNMPQLNGLIFTIADFTTLASFTLFLNTNQSGFTASTSFEVRKVYNAYDFSPNATIISGITMGSTTQVQLLTCCNGFDIGDTIKLQIPAVWGPKELNNKTGKILSLDSTTNTYTLELDTTGVSSFAWPSPSQMPFSYANMVGYSDSGPSVIGTKNTEEVFMRLGTAQWAANGTYRYGPAGKSGDVMFWRAGKDF
jgi:hypothetical protein